MDNQRFDIGSLSDVERTPQGGLRVKAHLTRAGVFEYQTADGRSIREYRPPDEVFAADSLATLADAPITVEHPGLVNPDNHGEHSQGHVREPRQDGNRVEATVIIQGRKAINAVDKGKREVSCGYICHTDEAPGITPDGEAYDRVQRNIRYNHVALVTKGRAGSDIRLRLDAAGNQELQETRMSEVKKVERIDGVEHEVGSDGHIAAITKGMQARVDKLTAELASVGAKYDAAEADKKKLIEELTALKDPARLDAAVKERVGLVEAARKVLGEAPSLDGLDGVDIKAAVANKIYPSLKLDSKDTLYHVRVDALYQAALAHADSVRADAAATQSLRAGIVNATVSGGDIMAETQAARMEYLRNAWKGPSKEGV